MGRGVILSTRIQGTWHPHGSFNGQGAPEPAPKGITHVTAFAGAPPGHAERGAVLGTQGGSVQVGLAAAILDLQPAGAFGAVCGERPAGSSGRPTPAHSPAETQASPGRASGSRLLRGASHLGTRCQKVPGGCRGRTRRRRSRPGCGTRHSHTGWTGTRRCLQRQPAPDRLQVPELQELKPHAT